MLEANEIEINPTVSEDLEELFIFQTDSESNYRAAFTAKDPKDKKAFMGKFLKLIVDPTIHMYTIRVDNIIVGSVSKYLLEGEPEITYWLDRKWWGKGIATIALNKFLQIEKSRPIYGRAAYDNKASLRVLEKCGFIKIGTNKDYANARQAEIEEIIFHRLV